MSEAIGAGRGRLLKVVEVHPDDKVLCRAAGCGRGVYKRIHVVEVDGAITVMGSDCFDRLYGMGGREDALYGGSSVDGEVRMLTAEERALMEANTVEFIDLMRFEYEEQVEAEMEALEQQLEAQRRRAVEDAQRQAERNARIDAIEAGRREAQAAEERRQAEKEALQRAIDEFDPIRRVAIESAVRDELHKAYQINVSLPGWAGWYKGMVRDRIIESLGKAPRKPAQVVGADDQDVLHGSGNKGTSWVEEDESDEAPASGTGVRAADRDDPGAAGKKDAGEQASLW